MSKNNENDSIQSKRKSINEIISMCNQNVKKNEKNNLRQTYHPNKFGFQRNSFRNEQNQNFIFPKKPYVANPSNSFSISNYQNPDINKSMKVKKFNNNKEQNKFENANKINKNNFSNNAMNKDNNSVSSIIKQINQVEEKTKISSATNNKTNINQNIINNAKIPNPNYYNENIIKSKENKGIIKNQNSDLKIKQESKTLDKSESFRDKIKIFTQNDSAKERIKKNEPKKQDLIIKKDISNSNSLNNNINNNISNNINNNNINNNINKNINNNTNSSESNNSFNDKIKLFGGKNDRSEINNNINCNININQLINLRKRNSTEISIHDEIDDNKKTEKKDADLILQNLMELKNKPKKFERSNTSSDITNNQSPQNKNYFSENNKILESSKNSKKSTDNTINKIHNTINYSSIHRKLKNKEENIIILEQVALNEKFLNTKNNPLQNFCESFFLSSFPPKTAKLIENSIQYKSDCNHKFCESFPAIQPEILYKYPKIDSSGLEINNLAASICFPNGIKVCYEEMESRVSTLQNYSSSFTNQSGDRYFSMIYRFYLKVSNNEYYEKYIPQALIEKIIENKENSDNSDIEIYNMLESLKKNKKYVFIPCCICLISKYPLFSQMEKCLQSIFLTMKNPKSKSEDINKLITYIIKSIPAPKLYSIISFPMPNCSDLIELYPTFYQEFCINSDNPSILLEISTTNIILIFRMLLFEQRILLISKHYELLSTVTYNFISLLYPFTWVHTYIPVMTEKMLKYLQSFLPFINGMHKDLYQLNIVRTTIYKSQKGLYIFDIDENTFELNTNLNKKKKSENVNKYINKNLPSLPKKLENMLIEQINIIKKSDYKNQYINNNILASDIKLKNLFISFFYEILFDYKKYLNIIDDFPIFNSVLLLEERQKKGKDKEKEFYQEISTSQLFQMFIQNSLNYIDINNNSINKINPLFFDEKIKEIQGAKKENEKFTIVLNKEFDNSLLKYYEIKTNYVIPPDVMSSFKENKKKEKNILSKYHRILSNILNLENDNNITNCIYYPLSKEDFEIKLKSINKVEDSEKKTTGKIKRRMTKFITTKDNKNTKSENSISIKKESIIPEISEEEIDDIKDNIRDILTRIFKSGKIDVNQDQKTLLSSIENNIGKDYFINIIYPKKNKTEKMNTITEDSYNLLEKVISNTIINLQTNENDVKFLKNVEDAEKLLKSCLYFRTVNNKKEEKLLSQNVYNQLNKCTIIDKKEFWEKWVESELNDEDHEIFKNIKSIINDKENYHYINEDDENIKKFRENFYSNLEDIRKIMIEMKISKGTILEILSKLCMEYIDNEEKTRQLLKPIHVELFVHS